MKKRGDKKWNSDSTIQCKINGTVVNIELPKETRNTKKETKKEKEIINENDQKTYFSVDFNDDNDIFKNCFVDFQQGLSDISFDFDYDQFGNFDFNHKYDSNFDDLSVLFDDF